MHLAIVFSSICFNNDDGECYYIYYYYLSYGIHIYFFIYKSQYCFIFYSSINYK